jgi:hypothetical protein
MEFPPGSWPTFPAEEFETAGVRSPGELGVEVMAQLRDTGRIQDHYRLALGGDAILKVSVPVEDVLEVGNDFPDWDISFSQWPAELKFSRNRTTTGWNDLIAAIAEREVLVVNNEGENVPAEVFLEAHGRLKQGKKLAPSASFRWAIGVGPDLKMELTLQSLPASPATLDNKPHFRG